jgi:hypothetical protein
MHSSIGYLLDGSKVKLAVVWRPPSGRGRRENILSGQTIANSIAAYNFIERETRTSPIIEIAEAVVIGLEQIL